jgi:hypothetical protein
MKRALHVGLSAIVLAAGTVVGCGSSPSWEPAGVPEDSLAARPTADTTSDPVAELMGDDGDHPQASLADKIANYAPAVISTDLTQLAASEKSALDAIIEASKLLDPIFDRQAYAGNPELEKKLAEDGSSDGKSKLAYFRIHRGPWDRQDHHRPFAIDIERPPGAGFYPIDLTLSELDDYLKKFPAEEKKLLDLFTVVERKGDKLVPIAYSTAYAEWLKPAAAKLLEAATLTKNKSLQRFLRSRAAAFMSDNYYQSDKDWMDLDGQVEVTIGPYEVYEDSLKATKAAFESFVTVTDPEASKKLAKYKNLLVAMEQNLPVADEVKTTRGRESPIRVVDLVFSAGDARKSVQTIAFNLPNDERVRKEKGAKKVLLRNVIQKKFDVIMRPIAGRILDASQQKFLSADAFFNQVLFHELSHSLGPATITKNGKEIEVRQALESTYTSLEECKADTMGTYNILFMIKEKEFPASFREQVLTSYFAGLFRSVRFGVAESHGKGAAIQINRYLEAGAATFDAKTGRFQVDFAKLEKAITELTRDLVMVQHNGDKAAAEAMIAKYAVMSPAMKQALASVEHVPVDLRPSYPAAGE